MQNFRCKPRVTPGEVRTVDDTLETVNLVESEVTHTSAVIEEKKMEPVKETHLETSEAQEETKNLNDTKGTEDNLNDLKVGNIAIQKDKKMNQEGQEDKSQEDKSPSATEEFRKSPQTSANSLMKILSEAQRINSNHQKSGSKTTKSKAKPKPKPKALPAQSRPSVASKHNVFNCRDIREFYTGSSSQMDSSISREKVKGKVTNKFSNSDSGEGHKSE